MASADSSDAWRRPEDSGPFPREWDRFQGLRPMPDGRVAHFWIREITEDDLKEALTHMVTHFLRDEQCSKASRALDDPLSVSEMEGMWSDAMKQRVSLGAFTDWPDGQERLAGLNVLGVVRKEDPQKKMQGAATGPVFNLMNEMSSTANVFARYGVSRYMVGLGLSASPEFRGQGLGVRLLLARDRLCPAVGLPLTVTAFSGAQSQKQSERAGFELLETRQYADFVHEDGSRPFASATWPCMQLKAKFYGPREDQ